MKKSLLICLLLQLPVLAHATAPASPKPAPARPAGVVSDAERYARRCQSQSGYRIVRPQGTMLWGTKRDWNTEKRTEERSSVLVSTDLAPLRWADDGVTALRLEGGHLVASPAPEAGATTSGVVGTVLQGTASDGKPVEVAICGAEPSAEDPGMVFYRIEAWNAVAQEWENPCVAVDRVPDPRALAVSGVWDASGARKDVPGKLTFACQNGAITKCILWGYKPWASRDGQSLADFHQACTRLVRADYCGDGRSHTRQNTTIDIYDRLGMLEQAAVASAEWDPARASFEAAWAPDGATCLARTRDDRALETILQECPNRFQKGAAVELGKGERCTVRRADVSPGAALLRNLSYGASNGPASQDKSL
ncbi:ADYC domain-containing protein [Pyxidicoccus trucidator]|uniref:ADYC domain-containing protein n=1 Tax=Pyxidicoccus trucidator TaxID=2709662 RepID=UPI0013DC8F30|nr:ADYC domain-containing protein [Pyxidicoccus trucidator]